MNIKDFVIDYCQRHAHPVNALLHLIGVPLTFYGLYVLVTYSLLIGFAWIILGYFLQYLGHKAQGNEVGEVILIKKLLGLLINKYKKNRDAHSR